MRQDGIVIEQNDDEVLVCFAVAGACTGACRTCGGHGEEIQRSYWAQNEPGAEPGQRVLVDFSSTHAIKSAAIIFLLPIGSALLGAILGQRWFSGSGNETASVLGAMIFLALSIAGVMLYDRRLKRENSYRPRVIEILAEDEDAIECSQSKDL
jgi:positive regulator of sigma E activity